ncbi:MAG: carboxypeptidase regulatory-like domain-containing protein [Candidatus Omnitrophica bacterium]|nr:carboxypeptidase regulatory-like domain-containing protein [Candidatus Omnitrophota bacterium]
MNKSFRLILCFAIIPLVLCSVFPLSSALATLIFNEKYVSGRGAEKILILLNENFYPDIASRDEWRQYITDLESENFNVSVFTINITMPDNSDPAEIRRFLASMRGLKGAILIGKIPSACYETELHGHHIFPTDLFYADFNGAWNDSDADGIYDSHTGDIGPEIWVGRLPVNKLGGYSCPARLVEYLAKNHAYRIGQLSGIDHSKALSFLDCDAALSIPAPIFLDVLLNLFHNLYDKILLDILYPEVIPVSINAETTLETYKQKLKENYEWVFLSAHGDADRHIIANNGEGQDLYYEGVRNLEPKPLFYYFTACYGSNFEHDMPVNAAYIFHGNGLAVIGFSGLGTYINPETLYTDLDNPRRNTLGDAYKNWHRNLKNYFLPLWPADWIDEHYNGLTFLGDPTLTLDPPIPMIQAYSQERIFKGQSVSFQGLGGIREGDITGYSWRSDLDGFLSDASSFTTDLLSTGGASGSNYNNVRFKVRDDKGRWSSEAEAKIKVLLPQLGGTVSTPSGQRLANIELIISPLGIHAFTNQYGVFQVEMPGIGTYGITPVTQGYTFSPTSQLIEVNGDNTGTDFTVTNMGGTVSGRVTDQSGNGVSETDLNFYKPGGTVLCITTNNSGEYSISSLTTGTYTVSAVKTGYVFEPGSRTIILGADAVSGVNFQASPEPTYQVTGKVSITESAGLAGVTIAAHGPSGTVTAQTDANGNYVLSGLRKAKYALTASKMSYKFVDATVSDVAVPNTINFSVITSTVSGSLETPSGKMLFGFVKFTGKNIDYTRTEQTIVSGGHYQYSAANLPVGEYTVNAQAAGYTFQRPSVDIDLRDPMNCSFLTYPGHSVSGMVVNADSGGMEGVRVIFSGVNETAVTTGTGYFSIRDLPNATYTIRPFRPGYKFEPASLQVGLNGQDVSGITFTGVTFSITGSVKTVHGIPVSDVTIDIAGPSTHTTTQTNGFGVYKKMDLRYGVYTITPSKTGYTFDPPSRAITISAGNATDINFTMRTGTISGILKKSNGLPVAGATVTFSGVPTTANTDHRGWYMMTDLLNGNYTVTPSDTQGYLFSPAVQNVTINNAANLAEVNFAVNVGAVSGTAMNMSGTALPGVNVEISGVGSILTDAQGNFRKEGLADGTYTITASKAGYNFNPQTIVIANGNRLERVNFVEQINSTPVRSYLDSLRSTVAAGYQARIEPAQTEGRFWITISAATPVQGRLESARYQISAPRGEVEIDENSISLRFFNLPVQPDIKTIFSGINSIAKSLQVQLDPFCLMTFVTVTGVNANSVGGQVIDFDYSGYLYTRFSINYQNTPGNPASSLQRTGWLHFPNNQANVPGRAAVLNFHGGLSNAAYQMLRTEMNRSCDQNGYIAVYPDAVLNAWSTPILETAAGRLGINDTAFINALLDWLLPTYGIDRKKVFATGISNGGQMVYALATPAQPLQTSFKYVFSAIGVVASGIVSEDNFQPASPMPAMIIHGTEDQYIPYAGGPGTAGLNAGAINYLGVDTGLLPHILRHYHNGDSSGVLPQAYTPYPGYTADANVIPLSWGNASKQVVRIKIHGAGHTWPGGTFPASLGQTNMAVIANAALWNFFANHPLPGAQAALETPAYINATLAAQLFRGTDPVTGKKLFALTYNVNGSRQEITVPLEEGQNTVEKNFPDVNGGTVTVISNITLKTIPSAPSNLSAQGISPYQINLVWADNSEDETGFRIQRSSDSAFSSFTTLLAPAGATSFTNTGLTPGTRYYYRVFAYSQFGPSEHSNIVNAATQNIPTAAILGCVTTIAGIAVGDVTINFSGPGNPGTAQTDTLGRYEKPGLVTGTYTVTPSKPGYTFTPASLSVNLTGSNRTNVNFIMKTGSLSGFIKTSSNLPAIGIGVTISPQGGTVTTDARGYYSKTGLFNGSYTVTPFVSSGNCIPASKNVTIDSACAIGDVHFTIPVGKISGVVTTGSGTAIPGVTMSFAGAAGYVVTDARGYFEKAGLADWTYTVYASKAGLAFNTQTVAISRGEAKTVNFIPAQGGISGTIRHNNVGLAGVKVILTPTQGGASTVCFTNLSGNYGKEGLANSAYYAIPSRDGYTFTPALRIVIVNGGDTTGLVNFTATRR